MLRFEMRTARQPLNTPDALSRASTEPEHTAPAIISSALPGIFRGRRRSRFSRDPQRPSGYSPCRRPSPPQAALPPCWPRSREPRESLSNRSKPRLSGRTCRSFEGGVKEFRPKNIFEFNDFWEQSGGVERLRRRDQIACTPQKCSIPTRKTGHRGAHFWPILRVQGPIFGLF